MCKTYYINRQDILDFFYGVETIRSAHAYEWEDEGVVHIHLLPLKHSFGHESRVTFVKGDTSSLGSYPSEIIVLVSDSGNGPSTVLLENENGSFSPKEFHYIPSKEDLYSRSHGLLEVDILNAKRVVIVGLGSFGSQIAIELAKAGVGDFSLFDFDRVELHNLARHTCCTNDLGRLKTDAIEDAILAVNMLKNDPRIDPEKVFLIGHSMGAMLAGRIDAEGADCAGLVMMAGIPFTLDKVLERQISELAEGSKGLIGWIMRKQLNKIKASFEGLYEKDPEELKQTKMGGGTTLYYFREMGDHPVSMYLKDNQKPILIMQGEKDFQVRADTDYKAFQEMLGGKDNVTFRLFPGLNHMFVTAKSDRITDSKNEYKDTRHIPDDVIQTISDWIFQCCEAK